MTCVLCGGDSPLFDSEQQLRDHLRAAHGATGAAPDPGVSPWFRFERQAGATAVLEAGDDLFRAIAVALHALGTGRATRLEPLLAVLDNAYVYHRHSSGRA